MRKILIFKNDLLGDFLHLSGCINSIHENFKNSKITLICSAYNYKVAKNLPFIDKYIDVGSIGSLNNRMISWSNFILVVKLSGKTFSKIGGLLSIGPPEIGPCTAQDITNKIRMVK